MFWVWIGVFVLIIVGASVLIGKTLSRPRGGSQRLSRHEQMTALKASGAMRNRKESRR